MSWRGSSDTRRSCEGGECGEGRSWRVHVPSHGGCVLESAGASLAVVVLVPVGLVDDLFRDDLLDDVYHRLGSARAQEKKGVYLRG